MAATQGMDTNQAVQCQQDQSSPKEKQVRFAQEETDSNKASTKHKSSMAPVLRNYGLEDKKRTQEAEQPPAKSKAVKPAKKKTPAKKEKQVYYDDADEEREKMKTQHYLQVYDDAKKAEKYYHNLYLKYKQLQVEEQREQIKQSTDKMERRLKEREEQQREERLKQRKKMERHNVSHDNSFLRSIPKSDYYKILIVQQRMQSEGKLKTCSDVEEFWEYIRHPGVLQQHYPSSAGQSDVNYASSQTMDSRSRTSSTSTTNQTQERVPEFRPMSGIYETKEPSRPGTRENWAITQKAEHQHMVPASQIPTKKKDPMSIAKQAAVELDKRFPMMNTPQMHCMDMEIGEKPPDPDKLFEECDAKRREKELLLFRKRLRRMHNLSQTHMASAHRILEKHEKDEELFLESPSLGDVLAVDHLLQPVAETGSSTPSSPDEYREQPWMRHLNRRTMVPIWEDSEASEDGLSWPRSNSRKSKAPSPNPSRPTSSKLARSRPVVLEPLTLGGVEQQGRIMEAKCLSTLWVNYTRDAHTKSS